MLHFWNEIADFEHSHIFHVTAAFFLLKTGPCKQTHYQCHQDPFPIKCGLFQIALRLYFSQSNILHKPKICQNAQHSTLVLPMVTAVLSVHFVLSTNVWKISRLVFICFALKMSLWNLTENQSDWQLTKTVLAVWISSNQRHKHKDYKKRWKRKLRGSKHTLLCIWIMPHSQYCWLMTLSSQQHIYFCSELFVFICAHKIQFKYLLLKVVSAMFVI